MTSFESNWLEEGKTTQLHQIMEYLKSQEEKFQTATSFMDLAIDGQVAYAVWVAENELIGLEDDAYRRFLVQFLDLVGVNSVFNQECA